MLEAEMETLYKEHRPRLLNYFRRACGDPALAEDLSQEVFARAVRAGDSYREQGTARAWLFAIARRLLADHRRTQVRRPPPRVWCRARWGPGSGAGWRRLRGPPPWRR